MISVIIFTLNSEAFLVSVLSPLMKAVMEGHLKEVIVWDLGSTDSTFEIADETGCAFFQSQSPSVLSRKDHDFTMPDPRPSIDHAKGDWYLLLTDQSCLSENWLAAALKHMQNHPIRAGYFPLKLMTDRIDRLLLQWLLSLKLSIWGEPLDIQALLISRPLFETLSQAEFSYHIDKVGDFSLKKVLGKRRLRSILGAHIKTQHLSFQALLPMNEAMISIWAGIRTILGFPPKPPKV